MPLRGRTPTPTQIARPLERHTVQFPVADEIHLRNHLMGVSIVSLQLVIFWRFPILDFSISDWFIDPVSNSFPYAGHWFWSGVMHDDVARVAKLAQIGASKNTLIGIVLFGLLLNHTQLIRSRHFLSHHLWTSWICWTCSLAGYLLVRWCCARHARNAHV